MVDLFYKKSLKYPFPSRCPTCDTKALLLHEWGRTTVKVSLDLSTGT